MRLVGILRTRLIIRIGLVEPAPLSVQASADADSPVGRWFAANLDIRTLLAVGTLLLTLIANRVTTQSTISRIEAQGEGRQREIVELRASLATLKVDQDRRFSTLYGHLNAEVVRRGEYTDNNAKIADRFASMQAQQLQIYGTLLARPK